MLTKYELICPSSLHILEICIHAYGIRRIIFFNVFSYFMETYAIQSFGWLACPCGLAIMRCVRVVLKPDISYKTHQRSNVSIYANTSNFKVSECLFFTDRNWKNYSKPVLIEKLSKIKLFNSYKIKCKKMFLQ